MTTTKIAIQVPEDYTVLVELYPQTYANETREGWRKWLRWCHAQGAIKAADQIKLDIWFQGGVIKFKGKTYAEIL